MIEAITKAVYFHVQARLRLLSQRPDYFGLYRNSAEAISGHVSEKETRCKVLKSKIDMGNHDFSHGLAGVRMLLKNVTSLNCRPFAQILIIL